MIKNAKEARDLVIASDQYLNDHIAKILVEVERCAAAGKCVVDNIATCKDVFFHISVRKYENPVEEMGKEREAFLKRVIKTLQDLGFSAAWVGGESFEPRGADGVWRSYHLDVRW